MADSRDIIISVNVVREPRGTVVQTQLIRNEPPYVKAGIVTSIVGKDGSLIYTGSGEPLNTLGVFTDLYIDTVAPNNYYQKDATNVWVLKGSFKGADGANGKGIVSFEIFDVQEKTKIYRLLYTDDTYVDICIIDGNDGVDGLTPYIGMNGNWWIGDVDKNIKAEGVDGVSPTIGMNGNWYLGAVDTGVKATATSAYQIYVAGGGTLSEVDYNESITEIPSHISDATKHIDTTTDEFSGTIDETNDKFTLWDKSLLKWIRFSFTSMKTWLSSLYLKLDQTTPQTTVGRFAFPNIAVDTNLIYTDSVNKRVGIGMTNPQGSLHIVNSVGSQVIAQYTGGKWVRLSAGYIGAGFTFDNTADFTIDPRTGITDSTPSGKGLTMNGPTGNVGIGTTTPKSKLQVAGGIQCGDDTAAASSDKKGTTRYRATANASYVEMCVQIGVASFQWQTILTNTW